jgi:hypothetical protein
MNKINKQQILNKTHYGIDIYSHILRLHYPDEIVLHLRERDCDLCRNPFNANRKTLHVFIEKENSAGDASDKELARHEDSEHAIPAGDAFDFAALHYKQQGDELLQTLNREMHLHLYFNTNNRVAVNCPAFSFYKAPVSNVIPHKTVTLKQVYNAIIGYYYENSTKYLRMIADQKQARQYKAANFDYCTFSGIFTTRSDKNLVQHSGLLCMDFDHIPNLAALKQALLDDAYFETQLLFISPSGDGLKWIIPIDTTIMLHSAYFASIANYIKQTYHVEVDKSGRDISRACFLPHDPNAYINPKIK